MDPLTALLGLLVGLLGLAVGAAVDPLVDRVPAGGGLRPLRPACPTCGAALRGAAAAPVLWRLRAGSRCGDCGARPPGRRLVVELVMAAAFVALLASVRPMWGLPAFLVLAAVCVPLSAIDLATFRLPDALVLPAYPWVGGLLAAATALSGEWARLVGALVGGLALFGFYLVLHLINPRGMGFGDVKLSGVLGLALGWLGAAHWVVGCLSAFLLAAAVGLALMAARRAGRRTPIPHGPFMVAGALLGIVAGPQLVAAYWSLVL